MAPRKERVFTCPDCGREVVTRQYNKIRCEECAKEHWKKRNKERKAGKKPLHKHGDYIFYDSPEQIQKCLNCKRPDCWNCLKRKRKGEL